jgi:Zn-dependent protease
MTPTRQGSIHLFRVLGIDVFLHWSWFVVAIYSISSRIGNYHSPWWGALEYLALFLIVLLHECGHSLACRSVGGHADQIVLWPLGGVAYVDPPPRPGATLWSIAAGPLVNVALLPITIGVVYFGKDSGWRADYPDLFLFLRTVAIMNVSLLGFNLLPVYPLDGGQILRSLLWFAMGPARSLMVATAIGFIGGAALVALALWWSSIWIGVVAIFMLTNCARSFSQARALRRLEKFPRRKEFNCPNCQASPPIGEFWLCQQCRQPFDLFAAAGVCPRCTSVHESATCPDCGSPKPLNAWHAGVRDI